MTNTLRLLCIIFSFVTTSAFAATYTVKKGDTLANIARKRYGEPVFGPKGTINKILKQNPNLKMSAPLEPGQKINLESGTASYPAEKVPNAKPPPLPPEQEGSKFDQAPYENVAKQMDMMPRAPIKEKKEDSKEKEEDKDDAHVEVIPKSAQKPAAAAAPMPHAAPAEEHHAEAAESHEAHTHNYFSIIPQYSIITQTATEHATQESFALHSSPAWGAELGWDHWWNSSFSTVLTYTALKFTSKESSELTGTKVIDKMVHRGELALLNRVAPWIRLGLGMAYGDHYFVTGFPADAHMIKSTFLNAFGAAEITAFNSAGYEVLVNLKIAQLPGQSGDHAILAGTEYMGQLSLLQKMEKFSILYGIAYSTENQTLSDATESRKEWALKIGALF